jgi:hypothetical protein
MLFSKQQYFDSNGLFYFPGCFPSNSILTVMDYFYFPGYKIKIIYYYQNTVAWKITWKIKIIHYCQNTVAWKIIWKIKIIHYCQNTVAWKINCKIKIIHYWYFDSNGLFLFSSLFSKQQYFDSNGLFFIFQVNKNNPLLSKYCCLENNLENKIIHYCQNTVAWKIT